MTDKTAKAIPWLRSLGLAAAMWLCCCMSSLASQQGAAETGRIPAAARAVMARATELMDRRDYRGAIDELTAFRERCGEPADLSGPDPYGCRHPMIDFLLGNCLLFQKENTKAREAYARAVARDPDFAEAWLNQGKTCYDLGLYAEAARSFAAAYEKGGRASPQSLYCCAVARLMDARYESAVSAFETLFEKHADHATKAWREAYVRALVAAGQARRALPLMRELTAETSGQTRLMWRQQLLYQYLQQGMQTEALALATMLTRSDCTEPRWWKALAHVQLTGGHYKEALAALTLYGWLAPLSDDEKKLVANLHFQLGIPAQKY